MTDNSAILGSVPDGSGRNAWALGYNLGSNPMTLYRIGPTLGGNGIQATVGTVTVHNIDPTWTSVTTVYGLSGPEGRQPADRLFHNRCADAPGLS